VSINLRDPQWVMAIATIISLVVTIFLSLIALFKEDFIGWKNKPKIKFRLGNKKPHLIQGVLINGTPIWYFRLEIKNNGNSVAKNCYVRINSVISESGMSLEYFEPDKLKWSGAPRDMKYRKNPSYNLNKGDIPNLIPIFKEYKDISPKGGWEFCDLIESRGDTNFVFLSTGGRPSYNINKGNYIIEIEIFGDNIEPKKKKFKLSYKNDFPLIKIDWI